MERAAPKPSPTPGLVDGSGYERPDPPTATTVETNGSDGRRKGTSLLCTRWGHFYFGATAVAHGSSVRERYQELTDSTSSSAFAEPSYSSATIRPFAMPTPEQIPGSIVQQLAVAWRLQGEGRLDDAEACYRAVIACEPQRTEAMELLAGLRRRRGDLAEALGLYAAMMKTDRRSAEAASNHAVVLTELGRPAEALASVDRALILKPDLVAAHYNRGNALFALDRYAEALTSFARTLAFDPGHVDAYYNRGNALRIAAL
jgi:tetratricopeptide (TPR) repeat protein